MSAIEDLGLQPVRASVAITATFGEAAGRLAESDLSAIAVLDQNERIVGLFGEDELLRGIFPAYLRELHHTAFVHDDSEGLVKRLAEIERAPVRDYLREPLVVDVATSATHVAELLLHSGVTVVALAREGRFAGMLSEAAFCRALLRRLRGWPPPPQP